MLIPRLRILQLYAVPSEFVNKLLYVPSKDGPIFLQCSDLDQSDKALSQIKVKLVVYHIIFVKTFSDCIYSSIKLPARAKQWGGIPERPSTIPSSIPLTREAIIVIVPWLPGKTPCPVKDANRDEWTAIEREKGEDRILPKDIDELKKLASVIAILSVFFANQYLDTD